MRLYKFSVYFIGVGEEIVTAGCATDAVILACAERIKKGLHRYCYSVKNVDTGESHTVNDKGTLTVNYK